MSTAAPARIHPARAVLRTEARLFRREPGSLFWILALPAAAAGDPRLDPVLPGAPTPTSAACGSIDVYVPVAVLLALIMAGLQAMPPVLTGYRERGILRRMSATPVRPSALLSAQMRAERRGRPGVGAARPRGRPARLRRTAARSSPSATLLALLLAVLAAASPSARWSPRCPGRRRSRARSARRCSSRRCSARACGCRCRPCRDLLARIVELTPFGAAARRPSTRRRPAHWPGWSHLGCWRRGPCCCGRGRALVPLGVRTTGAVQTGDMTRGGHADLERRREPLHIAGGRTGCSASASLLAAATAELIMPTRAEWYAAGALVGAALVLQLWWQRHRSRAPPGPEPARAGRRTTPSAGPSPSPSPGSTRSSRSTPSPATSTPTS